MRKELYENIKYLIQRAEIRVFVKDENGTENMCLVNTSKLLTELDNYRALEQEADWLAQCLEERYS